MISPDGIARRLDRIHELTRGLCQEVQHFRCPDDLLSPREQKSYRAALTDGVVGLDEARVVLTGAVQRREWDGG
jgi:hypothetical protein